ncbi:MAG: hypothetical protein GX638_05535 [Crenarchaeota archaeon]|nr:hypothetical protein [Thermoproteota archaeon]
MIWLIDKLNKLAAHLLFKMSDKIGMEIWSTLLCNDIMCDVKYQWNDNDTIKFYIITEDNLSYSQIQKVNELVNKFNDEQYEGICIYAEFWTEEQYKDAYGVD